VVYTYPKKNKGSLKQAEQYVGDMDGSWPLRTSNSVTFHALSASNSENEAVRHASQSHGWQQGGRRKDLASAITA